MKTTGMATVLQVADVEAAVRFYRDVLGFAEDFRFDAYAGVSLGEVYLHLCGHTIWKRPLGGGAVSIFCDEVDVYFAEVRGRGARIELVPTDENYGMRDFVLNDPDGNMLTFGCVLG